MTEFNKYRFKKLAGLLCEDRETIHGPYVIHVKTEPGDRFRAEAYCDNKLVGEVNAEVYGGELSVTWSEVDEANQKKGLGAAMYDALETYAGMPLKPGSIVASPGALRLWKKRLGKTDQWMIDQYLDGLYFDGLDYVKDELGLGNETEPTDEQILSLARRDLGLV